MQILKDLISNHMLLAPVAAWLISQILKLIIHALVDGKFSIERLYGDGGMPSTHSATVMALAVMCGWCCGFASVEFAIGVIFASVVMRDATGVRREAGKHATVIKELVKGINAMFLEKDEQIRTEKLKEFVGHTPLQVTFGAILGAVIAIVYISVFSVPYAVF